MNVGKTKIVFGVWITRAVVFFALLFPASRIHAQLIHPGGWHTQADLTAIRTNVQAKQEPWITGWNAVKDDRPRKNFKASVSRVVTDKSALERQAHATYQLAMKWVATGDQEYADTAIGVIDEWVETVEAFNIEGPTLRLSTAAGFMAQAGEILAHGFNGEAGWDPAKVKAAQKWFKNKVYDPFTNRGDIRSANWGTSCVGGNMSMAVFCDSRKMLSQQVSAYKHGYRDTKDGCCGVAQYIFHPTGQAFESGRDQAHVQGGIGHLVEAALTAWNQEIDLVSYANYRLVAGVEYHARYNAGYDDVPWTSRIYNPCKLRILGSPDRISPDKRGFVSPMYFMCAKLFAQAGQNHPHTDEVIGRADYLPEFSNTSHPGMGQFAFVTTPFFKPDPRKKYYIDAPAHNLRIGADGKTEAPFTVPTETTGESVEWIFVASKKGGWHIQLAARGSKSRLRSRSNANGNAAMRSASSKGALTYYRFSAGDLPGTSFVTLPDAKKRHFRLHIDAEGNVRFVADSGKGDWESLKFTEVPSSK